MTSTDLVIYVMFPLVVAGVVGTVGLLSRISRRLGLHDTALAVLVSEVTPPNKPNLRELIGDVRYKQGIDAAIFDEHVKREDERYSVLDRYRHAH